jgi:hypothetical protein
MSGFGIFEFGDCLLFDYCVLGFPVILSDIADITML